jgi:hypothetical protein
MAASLVLLGAMVVSTEAAALPLAPSCVAQGCNGAPTNSGLSPGTTNQPVTSCIKSASCAGGAALAFGASTGVLFFAISDTDAVVRSRSNVARHLADLVARLRAGVAAALLRPPQTV